MQCVQPFCDPMDCVARQVPRSMEFSRHNTGVSSHSLLQGIFPTRGSNLGLLHGRQIPYRLSHREALISGIVESKWTLIHVPLAVRAVPLRSHLPLLPDSLECT